MKLVIVAAFMSLLVGCSSLPEQSDVFVEQKLQNHKGLQYGSLKRDEGTIERTASFVQWDSEYAVTAGHVDQVDGAVYRCEKGCDLQFFKHKAEAAFPQWREHVANEPVKIIGLDIDRQVVFAKGADSNETVTDSKDNAYAYRTGSTTTGTKGGMSGGPVYGADNKVIGMHIGAEQGNSHNFIYVPYSLIQSEWMNFKAKQAALQASK
jgi:hypothetical protein